MRYAVINAGGSGTRLWPMSRAGCPKQLLPIEQRDGAPMSLLRLAYQRLIGLIPPERIFVCGLDEHVEPIAAVLPELPKENFLGEPVGRDTTAAIGFASAILDQRDPDAVVGFVTSDHVIEPVEAFQAALDTAYKTVESEPDRLVVFGISPTSPHTGLGYIHTAETNEGSAVRRVSGFTEKPDAKTAERYVDSGEYLWNAGMFVWRADTFLAQLDRRRPDIAGGVRRIARAWSTPDRREVLASTYRDLMKISVDYAVMEGAAADGAVSVVPLDIDWVDIGSWPAFAGTMRTDADGNATRGPSVLVDSRGNIVINDRADHLVAAVGIRDTIIVHTEDVTLVCPRSAAERVKDLVARVRAEHGDRYM